MVGNRLVGAALGHQFEDLSLHAGVKFGQRIVGSRATSNCEMTPGPTSTAVLRRADGIDEAIDVRNVVLEEIADFLRIALEQLERIALLDVLRKDENRDLWQLAPEHLGRSQPVVGVRGGMRTS